MQHTHQPKSSKEMKWRKEMENTIIEGKLMNVKAISAIIFAVIMVIVNGIWFKRVYDYAEYRTADWKWGWDWVVERYGKNANVMSVALQDYRMPFLFVFAVSAIIALVFYFKFSKTELVVTDKRVYGKTSFGKRVDLPLDSISAVGTSLLNTIAVTTSSGAIKFGLISNRDEVHEKITSLLVNRQESAKTIVKEEHPVVDNPEAIKKFKELLDAGIITQEEFDAKKKQLLGL